MPPHLASAPNINHLWAALLVEELVRQGTTFFVVCPGSRSTPLAVAVGQNPRAEALVHWDERAAGFVALGWGRATGRPAAVVTTSGTAVANLLPATVEADADNVPLLLITADRPPELRETGANQTIRQPPIFQDVARWALDWPVPTPDVSPRWVLSTAAHAAHRAASGPVHLNLPFREPLGAQPDGTEPAGALGSVEAWAESEQPFVDRERASGAVDVPDDVRSRLGAAASGVIVVGDTSAADAEAARNWADTLGWPLLADLRAPRGGRRLPHDLVLTSERFRASHRPEAVVHVGGRITSKLLLQHLAASAPETYVHVDPRPGRLDPDGLVTHRVEAPASALRLGVARSVSESPWTAAAEAVRAVLADGLRDGLNEPTVARLVTDSLGDRSFVAAASMPVRDLDRYTEAAGVVANRGASGIDGTVATAYGVARGTGRPAVALVGDLALLHDQTSLALLRGGPPVVVVVINNDGGGIFHRLPIASGPGALADDTFERFFGTPHGLVFDHAAAQFGLAYHQPQTVEAFEQALDAATASGASALIEVRTDREEQAALRRRIEAAVAEAVDAALA